MEQVNTDGRRPSILQVVADGRPGGGTTVVLSLLDGLCQSDRWAPCLMTAGHSYLAREALARGVNVIDFDFFSSRAWRRQSLAALLLSQSFAAVHVHGLRAAFHWCAALGGDPQLPFIYTVHGLHQLHFSPPFRWLANCAEKQVIRHAAHVTYVSQADLELAKSWKIAPHAKNGSLIPNGVDLERISGMKREQRRYDAVFLGRWVPQKDPELAAMILAGLSQKGWRCAIGGGGELDPKVSQILDRSPGGRLVERLGTLSHQEALSVLSNARIVVMPSRWEGLPLLPMEAAALDVVVVASDLDACRELIPDPRHGRLVTSRLPADWIEVANDLLQCDLSNISQTARQYIGAQFSVRVTLGAYIKLYESLASHG